MRVHTASNSKDPVCLHAGSGASVDFNWRNHQFWEHEFNTGLQACSCICVQDRNRKKWMHQISFAGFSHAFLHRSAIFVKKKRCFGEENKSD